MRRLFTLLPHGLPSVRFLSTSRTLYGSVVPFKLADIGEGILQVEVLNVCVKPGDRVDELDRICEVQSDKATVEITSRFCGTVKAVHVTRGAITRVGSPLIDIELDNNNNIDAPNGHHANGASEQTPPPRHQKNEERNGISPNGVVSVLATPATRRMAKEYGIDLLMIKGTGRDGRVMKEDVLAFVESRGAAQLTTPAPTAHAMPEKAPKELEKSGDEIIPLQGIRRVMAATMTEAHAIPCFTACEEVNVTALLHTRSQIRDALARASGKSATGEQTKLTLMPFFIKAASLALRRFPTLNAHVPPGCEKMILRRQHNIGVAMDTPDGLVVPVLRDVQEKTIMNIALELADLIERGRAKRLAPNDLKEGTFTLSNIGPVGATYATPMLVPPQVGIGALGRMQTLPRFDEAGNVVKANIMYVSWTADHRVIDGATLVRFGNTFKQYLETPATMIADMQ